MLAKVSTAATLIVGPILDSTGAEYTGAVIGNLSISKNGGTLTALASAATLTHIANGQYTLVLTTGNTDTIGRAQITCNKSTYQCPPVNLDVLPATSYDTLVTNGTLASTTSGRTIVTDASGLVDANAVKIGPTGSGTAQTARDIGASVLLSSGTSTGQVKLANGYVAMTWADIAAPTTTVNLSSTTIKTATDVETDTQDIQTRLPAALTADGNIKADVLRISGDATAADNAEAFFDGTGYAGTNNVIPRVTLTDTCSTNSDMRGTDSAALAVNWTSTRAGYIDNLSVGPVAQASVCTEVRLAHLDVDVSSRLPTSGYTAPLSAAGTRSAVGLASASLDSQLGSIQTDTDDLQSKVGTPAATLAADIAAVKSDTGSVVTSIATVLARIGAFAGTGVNTILGMFKAAFRSDAAAPSDVGGTFDPTTDSLQAVRDRGDAAWLTATGFSTLDAAGVRTALGLATANLDTQLGAISLVTTHLATAMELDGSVYRFTVNALERAPSGGGGGGGDDLENLVPGSYTSGMAGYNLGLLDEIYAKVNTFGAGPVALVSPIIAGGDITILRGTDYYAVDTRSLIWTTDDAATWPDLTGASIFIETFPVRWAKFTKAMTVLTPTGVFKSVQLEMSIVETGQIEATHHPYRVYAVLASGHKVPLVEAMIYGRN